MDVLVTLLVRVWCYLRHPRLVVRFTTRIRRLPDPAFPTRVHDKYLWRKIFDHDPLFTRVSDKLLAKEFARELCPEVRVPRTLWTGTNPAEIPDDLLRRDVVVKANHGCGWNHFVRGRETDRPALERRAREWMARDYGRPHGEWGYRGVVPRLFVEELLPSPGRHPDEYKCYVASGRISYVFSRQYRDDAPPLTAVLDRAGRSYETTLDIHSLTDVIERPAHWEHIVACAETLAAPFDDIRVDLYEIDGEIWFSELTIYSLGGYAWIGEPHLMELRNDLWDLRRSWFLTTPQTGWRRVYANALRRRLDSAGSALQ